METLSLAFLFLQELNLYRQRVDDVRDDESEWECDDETTVRDDYDVTGTNEEVFNANDDGARKVPDLFDLISLAKWLSVRL